MVIAEALSLLEAAEPGGSSVSVMLWAEDALAVWQALLDKYQGDPSVTFGYGGGHNTRSLNVHFQRHDDAWDNIAALYGGTSRRMSARVA